MALILRSKIRRLIINGFMLWLVSLVVRGFEACWPHPHDFSHEGAASKPQK
jgi:hypothetical protein